MYITVIQIYLIKCVNVPFLLKPLSCLSVIYDVSFHEIRKVSGVSHKPTITKVYNFIYHGVDRF